MKVLWLTNIPSPYRVNFFNELGKRCELTVLFERKHSKERDKSWKDFNFENFKGIILKGIKFKTDSSLSFEVLKYLKKGNYDRIIVTNFSTPTGIIAIEYMRLNKIRYSLESDGGFPGNPSVIKEKIKKHIIKGANMYFSTAVIHDAYYEKYGANPNQIYRYPFTSIYEENILKNPVNQINKNKVRKELGIKEGKVILSIGQYISRKGLDVLIKAGEDINREVGIYIIGGEPKEEYIELKRNLNLSNLHFIDFQVPTELQKYYKAADLFVLPTREDIWGLVINEAMAHGLPVITTDRCIAGLELIKNGTNGFIVPVDNKKELGKKINKILNNEILQYKMSEASLDIISKNYTIENMVEVHLKILKKFKE
ncbi:glycosyltransferase family 4 protein [Planococcus sp. 107-1]|uniref:glycosyltransferase family 4 protein n=1 Tax=Planococcus sp. 107-1 TaxID=2908840 RepID=UPI001F17F009|nr:glycosyltransferase family 4 protein [Planococcus sp. 107-1]UJF26169.1 glycosyltransferase family 4 protein [Planococcus sp. 107-1]